MPKPLSKELRVLQEHVEKVAKEYGLNGFEGIYEMLDYDEINMVAAYCGFPVRYPHWKWGMEYDRLKKNHEYGLGKIYEMVINNDPCYAYLMESNSFIDQKIVMCHVTGHNDFFKNNFSIYPNPVNNVLNISVKNEMTINSLTITDLNGRVVSSSSSSTSIDVSNLSSGVYFVSIETNEGKGTSKFVKN